MMACVAADAGAANDKAALANNRQRNIETSPLFMVESLVSLRQGYKQKSPDWNGPGFKNCCLPEEIPDDVYNASVADIDQ